MNDVQQKSVLKLMDKNEIFIEEIDTLLKEIKVEYKAFDGFIDSFWELFNSMEKAHSHIYFLPFSNAYCITEGKFSVPQFPCLKDMVYGEMNPEFKCLRTEYFEEIEADFKINADKMSKKLSYYVEKISDLFHRIIASNSITRRLSGLEDKASELESKKELYWYPRELSMNEYSIKGSIMVPLCIEYPQVVNPFHRRMAIEYEYLFKSKNIHIGILNDAKAILQYINEFLPFAELVPLKDNAGVIINNMNNNVATPKQIQMGSDNLLEGEINIGNEGECK